MQGVTNQLVDMAGEFCDSCYNREYDAVVSSGEQVAAGLLAMCLCSIGIRAKSLNAWQVPILAGGGIHSDASISSVNDSKILEELDMGVVPVITGFQGISGGDVYTIGRGGSDATACAVASALHADKCHIYTDVDGVYTADPRIAINCKRLTHISYDEMYELSVHGATVLQAKSVLIAKQYNIALSVVSSFSDENSGETIVTDTTDHVSIKGNIAGIAHHCGLTIAAFKNHDEEPAARDATCIKRIAENIYVIPQCVKHMYDADYDDNVGLVTVVGKGLDNDGITNYITTAVANRMIDVRPTISGKLTRSFIVPRLQTELAVNVIHEALFH
jgi:aspartate kinase